MIEIFTFFIITIFFILIESFIRSLMQLINRELRRYDSILSKYDRDESLLLSLAMVKGGMSTKGQRVSTANEGGLTSEAAFLFASVPRLSFHSSFIQESHAECLEDTRWNTRNVYSSLFFSLILSTPACWKKKDYSLGGKHVTLRIPAVHPWRKWQPSRF